MKTQKLKQEIKRILWEQPKTRDNDRLLTITIWQTEFKEVYGWQFFQAFRDPKNLTSQDTITRMRRLLQQQNPELRGARYMDRMEKETEVRYEVIEGTLDALNDL